MKFDAKILNTILANESNNIEKRSYTTTKWDSSPVHKDGTTYANQSISCNTLIKKIKNHMITSIDAEKAFDKSNIHSC